MKPFRYSASVMCANLARLEDDIKALEAAGCEELHFDIMDGVFVPNLTLGFDVIKAVKKITTLPISAHLMIVQPERYIDRFAEAGCNSLSIHVEACTHSQRAISQIRNLGVSPGIAINPATPLTKLEYLLDYVDRVLVMTVDPGYAGQSIIGNSFERVKILSENIAYQKLKVDVEVDGNINVQNAALLGRNGASIFVLGTSSIFHGRAPIGEALKTFRSDVQKQVHLV